jgi:5-carboxymethyl-2-hydroxymuconate isomerase
MQIQYSANTTERVDMHAFCQTIAETILELGLYPKGGLRVRAMAADFSHIADGHPENAFIDMVFRIGAGRSDDDKKRTGAAVQAAAETFLGDTLTSGYFMLSTEIVEISKPLSWKTNSVHKRLTEQRN